MPIGALKSNIDARDVVHVGKARCFILDGIKHKPTNSGSHRRNGLRLAIRPSQSLVVYDRRLARPRPETALSRVGSFPLRAGSSPDEAACIQNIGLRSGTQGAQQKPAYCRDSGFRWRSTLVLW